MANHKVIASGNAIGDTPSTRADAGNVGRNKRALASKVPATVLGMRQRAQMPELRKLVPAYIPITIAARVLSAVPGVGR